VLKIYDLFCSISGASITQDAWLLNFVERNVARKKLKYKRYNDLRKALDSSGRVREMTKQHNLAQQRKTLATKKLGDLRQHYPEPQEILGDSNRHQKWLRFSVIANQTSRNPNLAKRFLNYAYINRLTKQHWKSNENEWYTSGDSQETKQLLDNGYPQLNMGLKWYQIT